MYLKGEKMEIKVLGGGCKKCGVLYENIQKVLKKTGIEADIVKVEDMSEIMSYGVMSTPAMVVDGEVKSVGKVLNEKEIEKILI